MALIRARGYTVLSSSHLLEVSSDDDDASTKLP